MIDLVNFHVMDSFSFFCPLMDSESYSRLAMAAAIVYQHLENAYSICTYLDVQFDSFFDIGISLSSVIVSLEETFGVKFQRRKEPEGLWKSSDRQGVVYEGDALSSLCRLVKRCLLAVMETTGDSLAKDSFAYAVERWFLHFTLDSKYCFGLAVGERSDLWSPIQWVAYHCVTSVHLLGIVATICRHAKLQTWCLSFLKALSARLRNVYSLASDQDYNPRARVRVRRSSFCYRGSDDKPRARTRRYSYSGRQ